jgi:hypothetical protein
MGLIAYQIISPYLFCTTLVERVSGFEEYFIFNLSAPITEI